MVWRQRRTIPRVTEVVQVVLDVHGRAAGTVGYLSSTSGYLAATSSDKSIARGRESCVRLCKYTDVGIVIPRGKGLVTFL